MTESKERTESQQRIELVIEEYRSLKAEQVKRIVFRDSLVYISIGALGTVITLVSPTNPTILFAVPPLSVILGWAYLINDQKISAIGTYIRQNLRQTILEGWSEEARDTEMQKPKVFGWEFFHRSDESRRSRKILQLAADQLAFVGPGVASLLYYALSTPPTQLALVLLTLELALLVVLSSQIFHYADLSVGD